MSIDKNQVKKVAKLSRISLDDSKLDSLSKDLAIILKFVEQLNKVDTKKIEPLAPLLIKNWSREMIKLMMAILKIKY